MRAISPRLIPSRRPLAKSAAHHYDTMRLRAARAARAGGKSRLDAMCNCQRDVQLSRQGKVSAHRDACTERQTTLAHYNACHTYTQRPDGKERHERPRPEAFLRAVRIVPPLPCSLPVAGNSRTHDDSVQ